MREHSLPEQLAAYGSGSRQHFQWHKARLPGAAPPLALWPFCPVQEMLKRQQANCKPGPLCSPYISRHVVFHAGGIGVRHCLLRTRSSVGLGCSENPGFLPQARQLPVTFLFTAVPGSDGCNCTMKIGAFICTAVLKVDRA